MLGIRFSLFLAALSFISVSSTSIAQTQNPSVPSNSTQPSVDADSPRSSEADRLFKQGRQQFYQGQLQNALQTFQQVLEMRRQAGDRLAEAEVLNSIAEIYNRLGKSTEAQKLIEQSLAIVKDSSLPQQQQRRQSIQAEALDSLGTVYFGQGNVAKALETAQIALAMRRQLGDRTGEGETLIVVGAAFLNLGKQSQARNALESALKALREPSFSPDEQRSRRFYEGEALAWIGYLEMISGNPEQAAKTLEQALAMNRKTGNRSYGELNTLYFIATLQSNQSKWNRALESYQQLLSVSREIGHRWYEGNALISIGGVYQGQNQNAQALAAYQQGLAVFKEIGDIHKQADTIVAIAGVYTKQKQFQQALEQYQQALVIVREIKDRPREANVLYAIGSTNFALQQYSQALEAYQQALPLLRDMKNHFVKGDPNIVVIDTSLGSILFSIGQIYSALGRYPESQKYLSQGVELLQSALVEARANKNRQIESLILTIQVGSYRSLSQNYTAQQQYQQAIGYLQKALELARQLGDREQEKKLFETFVLNYVNQGRAYEAQRDYGRALDSFQQGLKIAQENGLQHWQAQLLLYIGGNYVSRQDFAQALNYQQQALAIIEQTNDRSLRIQFFLTRGSVYQKLSRYAEAREDLQEARSLLEATGDFLGAGSILTLIGGIYAAQNQYEQALNSYKQAQEVLQKNPFAPFENGINADNVEEFCAVAQKVGASEGLFSFADNCTSSLALGSEALKQPFVLNGLNSVLEGYNRSLLTAKGGTLHLIGQLYLKQENYSQALAYYQQALPILHQGGSSIEGATVGDMGVIYLLQGRYDQALTFSQQALKISRGFNHRINEEDALNNLAIVYWAQKNIPSALDTLNQKATVENENLASNLAIGSEERKRAYLAGKSRSIDITIGFHLQAAPQNPEAARLALTTILQRKGRILDAVSDNVQRLRQNLQPEDQKLFDDLNTSRAALVNLFYDKQNRLSAEEFKTEVATLKAKIDKLEDELAQRSTEFRAEVQPVTLKAVQALIPADAALVEFVQYIPFDPKASHTSKAWGTPHYAAAVLRSQGEPKWVDLGNAATIDKSVASLRTVLATKSSEIGDKDDTKKGDNKQKGDRSVIDVTPTGRNKPNQTVKQLARKLDEQVMAPIRPLLGDAHHLLLSPDGQLTLIPFEALKDEQNKYLIQRYAFSYLTSGRDLLRFQLPSQSRSNPVVFAGIDYNQQEIAAMRGLENRRSGDLANLQFGSLANTLDEANKIKGIFPDTKIISGKQATEAVIKQFQAPSILHLATHGFFIPDQQDNMETPNTKSLHLENPLLRSGLALAGINNRTKALSNTNDGVLTALEVAGLSLRGTQLVVLSACETGLGDVKVGDGLYGLRRALVIAGSQSQVLSLWVVDDAGTKDLMVKYYKNLKAGKGRHEALREAQMELLKTPGYEHPYYWASFVPSGDWGVLRKAMGNGQ